ncbi:helicase-related protein [Candidatus Nitrospira bockiana]
MSHLYPFYKHINLYVEGRISAEDAARQKTTAEEILRRLKDQPGVVLADEVGMGKTFVALAVAVSVAIANRRRRPVVVMVPPSLQDKWPRDFSLFVSRCLLRTMGETMRCGKATRAEEFLKYLDDPVERRCAIIFVTHGAMSRGLSDQWVKLALIRQALRRRHGIDDLKRDLCKILGALLWLKWMDKDYGPELWGELLREHPSNWLPLLKRWGVHFAQEGPPCLDDDPVPRAVVNVLDRLNTDELFEALKRIPRRQSEYFSERLQDARRAVQEALRPAWKDCLQRARLRLPLLILDEAHHLKNDATQLASLFRCREASDDMEEVGRGALAGVFERMLFLTATPFQLGHGELCSVLERFKGVAWNLRHHGKQWFEDKLLAVRKALDAAQEAALRLDDAWGRLKGEHLTVDGCVCDDVDKWWELVRGRNGNAPEVDRVVRCYETAYEKMRTAEALLKPWVIRHLKARKLPVPHDAVSRRVRLPGRAIIDGHEIGAVTGLEVNGDAMVPFLLAARATTCSSQSRALFAEGLASSYEAFLNTRHEAQLRKVSKATDADDDVPIGAPESEELHWYLEQLDAFVPKNLASASISHPKVAATTRRVIESWRLGEKVLVFCHFVATGKALRRAISHALKEEIRHLGSSALGCAPTAVFEELDRLGKRFFDEDSPVRRACDAEAGDILKGYPSLARHSEDLADAVRRVVRTPSFLVRFFPLHERRRLQEGDMREALHKPDQSGMTLSRLLHDFFGFLENQCDEFSRNAFIDAVCSIQTGSHLDRMAANYSDDELQGEDSKLILPNVRLVNGTTQQATRQRLMLAFNTPFYPEILVASSVMAEGVDLHLNCRHVIHHDLCWNPSTLEQRTGRVDRVGAKAERSGKSIYVYLPYLSATQDEKVFRVVTDRERWFSVVMGEKFDLNEQCTEKLSARVPLPETIAHQLSLRLEV